MHSHHSNWDATASRSQSLDVRVKLFAVLCAIVAVSFSTGWMMPAVCGATCLALCVVARLRVRTLVYRLMPAVLLAVMIWVFRGFLTGRTPWVTLSLGVWHPVMTREGAAAGGLMALRMLVAMSILIVFCATTPVYAIFAAMRSAHISQQWLETGMLMYRYIFILLEQARRIAATQTMRLGYATSRRGLTSLGQLCGLVTLEAMDQGERITQAMIVRGYSGSLRFAPLPALGFRRAMVMVVLAGIFAALYLLTEGWMP